MGPTQVRMTLRFGVTRRRAFTLIEILIVVMILGILAAIVVPNLTGASTIARENTLSRKIRQREHGRFRTAQWPIA